MCIDPADAAAVQTAIAHERDDVAVRNDKRVMHGFVVLEKSPPSTDIANQQLAVNDVVATRLVAAQ